MRQSRGFTLTEIIIVVTTIAILTVLVVPQLASAGGEAVRNAIRARLALIHASLDRYANDHSHALPTMHHADPLGDAGSNNGWGVLVSEGYLAGAPLNEYTGSTAVRTGTYEIASEASRQSAVGWRFHVLTDTRLDVFAEGYDPETDTLAHE